MSELIRVASREGSQTWFPWGKYAPYRSQDRMVSTTQVSERPMLKDGVRVRNDGQIYDPQTSTVYNAKQSVVEMLKYCDGTLTVNQLNSRFGEDTLKAVADLGLLV